MKKRLMIFVAVIMITVMLMTSCAANNEGFSLVSVDEEKDLEQVVATIDGVDITKAQVYDYIKAATVLSGAPADYYFTAEMADEIEEIKTQTLEQLIMDVTVTNKAKEFGIDGFSAEELEVFSTEATMFIDQATSGIEMQVVAEFQAQNQAVEGAEFDAEVERRVKEWFKAFGNDQESLIALFKKEELYVRVQDYIFKDIDVSEEEVKAFYDTSLAEQEVNLTGMPENITFYEQMGTVLVYEMNDISNVRHILIGFDEKDQALVDEANGKYGIATTDEEKAAALAILAPAFKTIEPKVEQVQAKIDEGVDFVELIAEYGEDPGMVGNDAGYAVYEGQGQMIPEFEAASVALTAPLQISEPVPTLFGVHIIQLINIDKAGPIPYNDVKETLKQQMLNQEKSFAWEESFQLWVDSTERVEYVNRLKN
jgi:parvulin-like peptidyl-prolyl isomerase